MLWIYVENYGIANNNNEAKFIYLERGLKLEILAGYPELQIDMEILNWLLGQLKS